MNLREARVRFTELSVLLIAKAKELGYESAWDEVTNHQNKGHKEGSLHYSGCALDLLLYKDGVYCPFEEDYVALGEYWESLDYNCKNGRSWHDANHFSYAPVEIFGGRK